MKEIELNKEAWGLIAEDHYKTFLSLLQNDSTFLNKQIIKELGDIKNKSIIHLQCNTGADSISLARMGAKVTGIDLAPENIFYANKLAKNLNITNVNFIESDIMNLINIHEEKYDIVFTSEGVIGWLPDLKKWANTIKNLLKDDGFFYVMDSHPFGLMFDEYKFQQNELYIEYPYFNKQPDEDNMIGGYASEPKQAKNYFWMYTVSEVINSLINAGLRIEYFNEYDKLFYDLGGMEKIELGFYRNPYFKNKIPLTFSLKATVNI